MNSKLSEQHFAGNNLDRSHGDKKNEDLLHDCLQSPNSRILIITGDTNKKVLCMNTNKYDVYNVNINDILSITHSTNVSEVLKNHVVVLLGCLHSNPEDIADNLPCEDKQVWYLSISLPEEMEDIISQYITSLTPNIKYYFCDGRKLLIKLSNKRDLAISGQAIALSSFHSLNVYDGQTGELASSIECGLKRKSIGSRNKIYPRIDPVVIACVVSKDHQKCLLGKMKRHPTNFYSCLSGFIEVSQCRFNYYVNNHT